MSETGIRPNLFVIGAMRSGTTTLQRYLRTHPQVYMTTEPKEPTYFLTREQLLDVLPGIEKRGYWRGEDRYLDLFAGAGDRPIVGEASANYARLPRVAGVADRVAAFNPQARIVYVMRDPVERTISHYWYMVRFFEEKRDPLTAVRADNDMTGTSDYAMQLQPWLGRFGSERVYTLTMEQLRKNPQGTMAELFTWLGVDATFELPTLDEHANAAPPSVAQVRGSGTLQRLRNSSFWNSIGPRVPSSLRRLGRAFAERKVERTHVDLVPVRAYLRDLHQPQVRHLESMLGRTFPEWTSLR